MKLDLVEYQSIIESELSKVSISSPNINKLIKYILNAKGKRIRPILSLITSKALGGTISDTISSAIAIELIHNFTLVHDDIMDGDDMRHGVDTVHAKWDEDTAILAGDALLAIAYSYLPHKKGITRKISNTLVEVCEGQLVDKRFEKQKKITLEQYISMIDLKTGKLLGLASEMGAICAGYGKYTNQFKEFGILLGRAFQIQDDYLEIFSSTNAMGKSLSSDIFLGKKTYFLIKAIEIDEEKINGFLELAQSDCDEAVILIRKFLADNSLDLEGKNLIANTIDLAYSKINQLDIDLDEISEFVNYILNRNS